MPVPFSDAATAVAPAVIAGPVFATVIQTGLPRFGCVVPPGAKKPTAFSFGTSAPLDTIATAKMQKTSQYVVRLDVPAVNGYVFAALRGSAPREGAANEPFDHSKG